MIPCRDTKIKTSGSSRSNRLEAAEDPGRQNSSYQSQITTEVTDRFDGVAEQRVPCGVRELRPWIAIALHVHVLMYKCKYEALRGSTKPHRRTRTSAL